MSHVFFVFDLGNILLKMNMFQASALATVAVPTSYKGNIGMLGRLANCGVCL